MDFSRDRRKFLRTLGTAGVFAGTSGFAFPARSFLRPDPAEPTVGIQIAPFSLLDEGIEQCLDTLQEAAGVNAVLCYSHTYHLSYNKPPNVLADHGVPIRDIRKRRLPRCWVNSEAKFYKDTILGHEKVDIRFEYHDRDLFREMAAPAKKRGIKVYARILEASANRKDLIPNYEQVLTIDIYGKPGRGPCWNHPDYRAWITGTVRDLISNYPLDGFQYGAERTGPLSYLLYRGLVPTCFCEYCNRRNGAKGIDPARAKMGYTQLFEFINKVEQGNLPADGVQTTIFHYFQKYPEILSWNYEWLQADNEIHREIYDAVKAISPSVDVGRHVDHQRSSWDIWYRAAVPYAEMTESADFIKPILYHDILGPRLRRWVIEEMHQRAFRDMTEAEILSWFYAHFGHDATEMPTLEELDKKGLGAAYVYTETKRCMAGVEGKAKVIAGIGVDVPWHLPEGGMAVFPSPPGVLEAAVRQAFQAGAEGILISREYDEMRLESLQVIGRAIHSLKRDRFRPKRE